MQHFGDSGLQPLVRVGDDELHAAQAAAPQLAQELGPEGLGLGRADISMPTTSRRPSAFTPTTTIAASETMRPF
jgi:hypothetical protein